MHVNFGEAAPPSAPKKEARQSNTYRRSIWDGGPYSAANSGRGRLGKGKGKGRTGSVFVPALAVSRKETYDFTEIQPGDIDFEYTMFLLRCCPCLRPPPLMDPVVTTPQHQHQGTTGMDTRSAARTGTGSTIEYTENPMGDRPTSTSTSTRASTRLSVRISKAMSTMFKSFKGAMGVTDKTPPTGVNVQEEPEFHPWHPAMDEASGEMYWWNTETEETAWDLPESVVKAVNKKRAQKERKGGAIVSAQPELAKPGAKPGAQV